MFQEGLGRAHAPASLHHSNPTERVLELSLVERPEATLQVCPGPCYSTRCSDALFPIGPVDVKSVAKAGLRNFDKGEEDRITTASTDFGLTSTTHEEVFDVERDL